MVEKKVLLPHKSVVLGKEHKQNYKSLRLAQDNILLDVFILFSNVIFMVIT